MLLLTEVSDPTLAYDHGVKQSLYAQASIKEVWIVNLPNVTIDRCTDPSADGYRRVESRRRGQTLQSTALPGLSPTADEVLV